jgi:hypothetical protein
MGVGQGRMEVNKKLPGDANLPTRSLSCRKKDTIAAFFPAVVVRHPGLLGPMVVRSDKE